MLPDGNLPYMLMEFLEGESLSSRLDRARPLAVEVAVEIASQTASALAAAHSKGIVHRDLKPDNLFLVPDEMVPGGERVKVLDFGIAKLRDDIRGSSMKTRTGAIMGTAVYMSPEQCQGLIEKVDHRTDIYALGIILYEMLCGAPPFVSEGFGDIIIMHVMREPEPPQARNPSIPDSVAAAMLCALAKDPSNRFQSMLELQAALRSQMPGHAVPSFAPPSAVRTAILDEQAAAAERAAMPFDRTMATPAPVYLRTPPPVYPTTPPPVSLRSPSRPPRQPSSPPAPGSTMLDPAAARDPLSSTKQPTTFRTATGEVSDTDIKIRSKRSPLAGIMAVVVLAAAGLVVTILVTRPSSKPVPVETVAPPPEPVPIPPLAPPPPPPPDPVPAAEPPSQIPHYTAEEPDIQKGKGHRKPGVRTPKPPASKPNEGPLPPSAEPSKKETERW